MSHTNSTDDITTLTLMIEIAFNEDGTVCMAKLFSGIEISFSNVKSGNLPDTTFEVKLFLIELTLKLLPEWNCVAQGCHPVMDLVFGKDYFVNGFITSLKFFKSQDLFTHPSGTTELTLPFPW
jgi:hypothetical protein